MEKGGQEEREEGRARRKGTRTKGRRVFSYALNGICDD